MAAKQMSPFLLGEWEVQPQLNRLRNGDRQIQLEGKIMSVLTTLAGRAGQVVSKNELLDMVWENQVVTDSVLTRAVHELRRALGDDQETLQYIETVPRLGYRLLQIPTDPAAAKRKGLYLWRILAGVAALVILAAVLLWLLPNRSPLPVRSLAVVPLDNYTGDERNDYLANGITEEIIHILAQQENLSVAARTSSFIASDMQLAINEIGERLNVDAVIEGSLRKDDEILRVTVQLIDARSELHLASSTVDILDGDLFDAPHRLYGAIADLLMAGGAKTAPIAVTHTGSEAYDLYLRGRSALHDRSHASLKQAIQYFQEALDRSPSFARAHAGLAQVYFVYPVYTDVDRGVAHHAARIAAEKALALDAENADALAVISGVALHDHRYAESLLSLEHALDLHPNNAQLWQWYGEGLGMLGFLNESRTAIQIALQLDPLAPSTIGVAAKGESFFDDDRALEYAAMSSRLGAALAPKQLSLIWFRRGDIDAFSHELKRYYTAVGATGKAAEAFVRSIGGRLDTTQLQSILAEVGPKESVNVDFYAREYALQGEPELALAAIRSVPAGELRFMSDIWLPEFSDVRALPEFGDFLSRNGLIELWQARGLPDYCLRPEPEVYCRALASR